MKIAEKIVLEKELLERDVPSIISTSIDWSEQRNNIKRIVENVFLGGWPCDVAVSFRLVSEEKNMYGGKAVRQAVEATLEKQEKKFSFSFVAVIPKTDSPCPAFVHLNFNQEIAGGVGEELIDEGYAVIQINYQDVEPDVSRDSIEGLQGFMDDTDNNRWGKIAVWAYGASKAMDYVQTVDEIDKNRVAVIGHSRLGLAACVCGAYDERFSLTVCNNNGALYRGTSAESYEDLAREYTRYWFSKRAFEGSLDANELPFDINYLQSLVAPRHLYLAGADEDQWADAHSMLLSALSLNPLYESLGYKGIVIAPIERERTISCHEGRVGYHLRKGTHHLGRDDWHEILEYRKLHCV